MSLRKRRRAVAEINVVPYIDVMLVLLVIFIATAPVIMQGVKVDLPQAESKTLIQGQSCGFTGGGERRPFNPVQQHRAGYGCT